MKIFSVINGVQRQREGGRDAGLTDISILRKDCRHDRLVRNARHACINTYPLIFCYLPSSIQFPLAISLRFFVH